MQLPTSAEVNAATRHVASFAAGAVAMFGLSSKISPDTIMALVNALGALANDAITVVGILTPIIAAYYASRSASPKAQVAAVQALPAAQVVVTDPKLAEGIPGVEVKKETTA